MIPRWLSAWSGRGRRSATAASRRSGHVAAPAHDGVGPRARSRRRAAPTATPAMASARPLGSVAGPFRGRRGSVIVAPSGTTRLGPLARADGSSPPRRPNERVGDGQRRHHVPRRPAGGDHHPRHGSLRCGGLVPAPSAPLPPPSRDPQRTGAGPALAGECSPASRRPCSARDVEQQAHGREGDDQLLLP